MKLLLQPVDMAWASPGGGTHEEGVQEASPHGVLMDRGRGNFSGGRRGMKRQEQVCWVGGAVPLGGCLGRPGEVSRAV